MSTNTLQTLPKVEEDRTLRNSFCEVNINLIPKPKTTEKKKPYKPISFMNINVKMLNKILAKPNPTGH